MDTLFSELTHRRSWHSFLTPLQGQMLGREHTDTFTDIIIIINDVRGLKAIRQPAHIDCLLCAHQAVPGPQTGDPDGFQCETVVAVRQL